MKTSKSIKKFNLSKFWFSKIKKSKINVNGYGKM